jgi:NitT/TauT family transport system ATP-binding protein
MMSPGSDTSDISVGALPSLPQPTCRDANADATGAASRTGTLGRSIELEDVTFQYSADDPPILNGFDLKIEAAQFFCLLGPSGCGKTTVLNLVAGFETATSGRVRVGDDEVRRPGVDRPVIFQGDDSLFPWLTALDNASIGLRYAGLKRAERIRLGREAITTVGLAGHEHKFPHELSGGMKQRIQIARAIVGQAPVLLMDEPFASLDAQVRAIMQEEIARIWAGMKSTVLFITHDIAEALILGDFVGVMSGGPGASLKEIVPVRLPRPRAISTPGFGEVHDHIAALIRGEVVGA